MIDEIRKADKAIPSRIARTAPASGPYVNVSTTIKILAASEENIQVLER